jgi:AmiR/NasT family two-component response regulator
MDRILLLDPDPSHASGVADALRVASCQTIIAANVSGVPRLLQVHPVDVVVIVSHSASNWMAEAEQVRNLVSAMENPPQVLCVLRGPYRGPEGRVYGAQCGIRVIYEEP